MILYGLFTFIWIILSSNGLYGLLPWIIFGHMDFPCVRTAMFHCPFHVHQDVLAQERWRAKPGCRPGHNGPRSCPQCLVPTVPTARNRRAESNPFTKTHVIPCPDVTTRLLLVVCLMNLMRCEACCASFLSKNPRCWWPSFFGQGVDVSIIPSVVVTELAYPTLKIDGNRSMIPRDFRILEPVWLIHQRKLHMM